MIVGVLVEQFRVVLCIVGVFFDDIAYEIIASGRFLDYI